MKSKLKKRASILIFLIFLGILFALTPIISNTLNFNVGNSGRSSESRDEINFDNTNLKPSKISGPIFIDDNNPSYNWSVVKGAGICTGNGTFSDPYVIEDLVIDGGGSGSCIYIRNSDIYFRIENCTLYNAGTGDVGIELYNVDNSQLIDNIANNNTLGGIELSTSYNNTLSGNIANNNIYGIYLSSSDYNNVSGNTANNNIYGILVEDSNNINVLGNTINDNDILGILLSDANHTISGNNMNGCGLGVSGSSSIEELCSYDIDTTNLVNGKPLYYYTNEENLGPHSFTNAGQIILVNCTDSIIPNLDFSYCSNGITLYYCSANTILGNTGNNQRIGIMLFYSYDNTVSGNIENSNDYYGIYIAGSHNNTVTGNTVNNNNQHGIYLSYSNNNTISGNAVNDNNMHGIQIYDSNDNIISGNTVNNNKENGIYLHTSNNNTVIQNMIKDNLVFGLEIRALVGFLNSSSNTIYLNCFINNRYNAYDNGWNNHWDNGIKGNYWSDYTGSDADGDGIGDVAYNITGPAGDQKDNFPLMKCPISAQEGGGIPFELIILISVISGGAVIGVATLLLIIHKRKRIE